MRDKTVVKGIIAEVPANRFQLQQSKGILGFYVWCNTLRKMDATIGAKFYDELVTLPTNLSTTTDAENNWFDPYAKLKLIWPLRQIVYWPSAGVIN